MFYSDNLTLLTRGGLFSGQLHQVHVPKLSIILNYLYLQFSLLFSLVFILTHHVNFFFGEETGEPGENIRYSAEF